MKYCSVCGREISNLINHLKTNPRCEKELDDFANNIVEGNYIGPKPKVFEESEIE